MNNRSKIPAVVGGVALGAGLAVAVLARAQEEGQARTVIVSQPTSPTPGMRALPAEQQQLHVQALSSDSFVTVKDLGDAQVVSVFKLDPKGINHLTHKAKFFY